MKINPILNNLFQGNTSKKVNGVAKPADRSALDEVSFSSQAIEFSKLLQSVREESVSPAYKARVEEIGRAIADGTYSIDASAIAYRILSGGPK